MRQTPNPDLQLPLPDGKYKACMTESGCERECVCVRESGKERVFERVPNRQMQSDAGERRVDGREGERGYHAARGLTERLCEPVRTRFMSWREVDIVSDSEVLTCIWSRLSHPDRFCATAGCGQPYTLILKPQRRTADTKQHWRTESGRPRRRAWLSSRPSRPTR